uniref:Sodium/potassium-transporting ATPase subunit beta n=1 Tax=Hadrurus spadix TaxID=141984 RepID=A0A1W7RAX9_9SCOR
MADEKDGQYFKRPSTASKWQNFKSFLWNSDTKEFLGRTGLSWLKITVFYIIFYSCLAGFWTVMLVIFYQTLSNTEPRWTLSSSRIGDNPGLGFRPRPPESNIDSTLIWFDATNNDTIKHWVNNLNEFLEPYNYQRNVSSCSASQGPTKGGVCYFPIGDIGSKCSASMNYGYNTRQPCVLIKLNRIFKWQPEPYEKGQYPSDMPDFIKNTYDENFIYISCDGENAADKDNLGDVEYLPSSGINSYYFPFINQREYLSPFVFVRFKDIAKNVLINIECKAWARNIKHERADRLGMVHFEILAD